MSEQFRELERPAGARNKDVVLMATVTSFQALSFPGKWELRQFAELFQPLFAGSSMEARREAVAALSQCPNVPGAVALFIWGKLRYDLVALMALVAAPAAAQTALPPAP